MPKSSSEKSICDPMREYIFRRDQHRCQDCGSRENLVVHHINYRVPYTPENMITLCLSCHRATHLENERVVRATTYNWKRRD